MTSILVIDDHPLVADGVTTMLKSELRINVIGVAKTGKEALSFLSKKTADIILLDINLSDIDGLVLCEKIKALHLDSHILILTSINDFAIISQALSKGASGYLLKDMERNELLQAIDVVLSGKIYVSNAANEKLLEQYQNNEKNTLHPIVLTRREKEILGLLDKGMNGPQIAEHLFISSYTVETHRKNLMQKLNATNTQMLLKMAREFHFLAK